MAIATKKLLFLIALGLSLIGGSVVLWTYPSCPGLAGRLYRNLLGEDAVGQGVQFTKRAAGGGRTPDGFRFSFGIYESTDCVEVRFIGEYTDSVEIAQQKMRELVASASHVLERNEKLYTNGERAGPRAVLSFEHREREKVIIWTAGHRVHMIESSSLSHALEFEERYHSRATPWQDLIPQWKPDKSPNSTQ